jgi:predicted nucleic acid-binding protein
MGHYKMLVSATTVAELLATNRANSQDAHQQIRDFINENFEVLPTTKEVAEQAGDLLRELDITLAHACVAATAMQKKLPLLTYEIKTYDRIPDLQLIDI